MSLRHALLGFLDISPVSGYDLVKKFDESVHYFWHATHTQIYRTLKELEKKGLIDGVIHHQSGKPSKKIYHININGKKALKKWLLDTPSLPSLKHSFLLQLTLSSSLSPSEIINQLTKYEKLIKEKLNKLNESEITYQTTEPRNQLEREIWISTIENGKSFYLKELEWISKLKNKIMSISNQ